MPNIKARLRTFPNSASRAWLLQPQAENNLALETCGFMAAVKLKLEEFSPQVLVVGHRLLRDGLLRDLDPPKLTLSEQAAFDGQRAITPFFVSHFVRWGPISPKMLGNAKFKDFPGEFPKHHCLYYKRSSRMRPHVVFFHQLHILGESPAGSGQSYLVLDGIEGAWEVKLSLFLASKWHFWSIFVEFFWDANLQGTSIFHRYEGVCGLSLLCAADDQSCKISKATYIWIHGMLLSGLFVVDSWECYATLGLPRWTH